jgi:DNA mismatch repair protein MutL
MPIRKLPEDVTHRIAAGEVIERPASVVKELLENSLDAGASRLTVRLQQGGTLSIVVEDDGQGIPPEELSLAVERFATSKLAGIEDLERIVTLGFRGEALASIATVSRFEIRSRKRGEQEGAFLRIEGGLTVSGGGTETAEGTRVQVDDLFFNLPARRKFLKGAAAEQRRILKVIQETSIAAPHVDILLVADGKTIFRHERGTRKDAIEYVLGAGEARGTRFEKGRMKVEAWRANARPGKRTEILSFVNGRRIIEPTIRSSIFALGPEIAGDWVILVDCPPSEVDVNIHPAKAEVRFRNTGSVFESVHGAAKALLDAVNDLQLPQVAWDPPPLFFKPGGAGFNGTRVAAPVESLPLLSIEPESPAVAETDARFLGNLSEGFLVFTQGSDLVLMDPHAAHERVLYDLIRERVEGRLPSQRLQMGEELSPSLGAGVREHIDQLQALGFSFLDGDDGTLIVESIPTCKGLESLSPSDLLRAAIDAIDENSGEPIGSRLANRWAYAACHAAVKLGDSFTAGEAISLWQQLALSQSPNTCPHGRPTLLRLEGRQLRRHFGRKD